MKNICLLFFIFWFTKCHSQEFFHLKDSIYTKESLKVAIKRINKNSIKGYKYVFIPYKAEKRNDSIIKHGDIVNVPLEYELDSVYNLLGKKIPTYLLERQSGGKSSSEDLVGKPTIINFWFTSCLPCVLEIPSLNKIKEKYGDKINTIAITFEDRAKVLNFSASYRFDFEKIINSKYYIQSLGIYSYPKLLLLDRNSIVRYIPFAIFMNNDDETTRSLLDVFEKEIYNLINE